MTVDIYIDKKAENKETMYENTLFDSILATRCIDFYDKDSEVNPFFKDNLNTTFEESTPENIISKINRFVIQMTLVYGLRWSYIYKRENDLISEKDFRYIERKFSDIHMEYHNYILEQMRKRHIRIPTMKVAFLDMFYDIKDNVSELDLNIKTQVFFTKRPEYVFFEDVDRPASVILSYSLNKTV